MKIGVQGASRKGKTAAPVMKVRKVRRSRRPWTEAAPPRTNPSTTLPPRISPLSWLSSQLLMRTMTWLRNASSAARVRIAPAAAIDSMVRVSALRLVSTRSKSCSM